MEDGKSQRSRNSIRTVEGRPIEKIRSSHVEEQDIQVKELSEEVKGPFLFSSRRTPELSKDEHRIVDFHSVNAHCTEP